MNILSGVRLLTYYFENEGGGDIEWFFKYVPSYKLTSKYSAPLSQ